MSEQAVPSELLEPIGLFRGLDEAERRLIAGAATLRQFAAGELVLCEGKTSRDLWVLLEGRCAVLRSADGDCTSSKQFVLAELEPYQQFGEMSFFQPAVHSASVRAETKVRLLRLARADFDRLLDEGAAVAYKLAYNVVESLAERLRQMDDRVVELSRAAVAAQAVPEWRIFRDKLLSDWNL
jgi:CRP-like cAMP-binding protein